MGLLVSCSSWFCFFFQAEDGIRDLVRSRGLGDVYKRQRMFGVHIEEEGLALRGSFIINPEGVVKACEIHDLSLIHI